MALSLVFGAIFTTDAVDDWVLALIAVIIGIALGSFIAPNNTSVMSSAPEDKLGVANSMISLSTNVGFSIGTALATAIFIYAQNFFQKRNGGPLDDAINYVPAMKVLFAVFAIFMVGSTVFSWFRGPDPFKKKD
jgi:MFS family permease